MGRGSRRFGARMVGWVALGVAMLAAALHGPAAVSDEWVERIASVILDGVRAPDRAGAR